MLLGRVPTGTLPRRASPAGRLDHDHRLICPFAGPHSRPPLIARPGAGHPPHAGQTDRGDRGPDSPGVIERGCSLIALRDDRNDGAAIEARGCAGRQFWIIVTEWSTSALSGSTTSTSLASSESAKK